MDLFESAACIMYDMFDWKRQYNNYLENTNFQNIPEVTRTIVDTSGGVTTRGDDTSAPAKTQTGQSEKERVKKVSETPRKEVDVGQDQTDFGDLHFLDLANLDLNYYNDLLTSVPSDCTSVELIMHCLLEQVASSTAVSGEMLPPSQIKEPPRADGLDANLAQHLSGVLLKLPLTNDEKKVKFMTRN